MTQEAGLQEARRQEEERKELLFRAAEHLSLTSRTFSPDIQHGIRLLIIEATEGFDDHPDWYHCECFCALCRSYGDPE